MTLRISILLLLFPSILFSRIPGADSLSVAEPVNALGLDLCRLEAARTGGNVLLSPWSIQSALTMAFAGAEGKTRAEMAKVLHLGENPDEAPQQLVTLRKSMQQAGMTSGKTSGEAPGGFELRSANALFTAAQWPASKTYSSLLQDSWQARCEPLNFAAAPDSARQHINKWVEEQTAKRIVNLVPANTLNADTRMVLVNALYFRASWAKQFDAKDTKPHPFHVAGNVASPVPTMYVEETIGYTKEPSYEALTIPYRDRRFQFLIVLPAAKDGLPALEKNLTAKELAKLSKLPERYISLYLPKFKIQPGGMALGEHLKNLGMPSAFDTLRSNFSRMSDGKGSRLSLSEVFHKTFVSVDEKGTEAAAATATDPFAAGTEGAVHVDRPFLFAVQHRETGLCLFLGRVTDPR